jgi:hypothetical protein
MVQCSDFIKKASFQALFLLPENECKIKIAKAVL